MKIIRVLVSRDSRKYTNDLIHGIANLSPLVGDSPDRVASSQKPQDRLLDHRDGNWLFITISLDPKTMVVSRGSKRKTRFGDCSYTVQLETCLRYYETVYFPYLRGFSFGSWELDKSGKLHVHILHHSEDKIEDTYVLQTIRQGVKSHAITQEMCKGKIDYCNSIVQCRDPADTLTYLKKDHDKKIGLGLPAEKYFYWSIV